MTESSVSRSRRPFVRRTHADRHARLMHRVWLLGLAGFVTSVTVASIPPRDDAVPAHLKSILATPPQVLDIAPVSRLETRAPQRVAAARHDAGVPDAADASAPARWEEITVRRGDTLSGLMARAGQEDAALMQFVRTHPEARSFSRLRAGQTLRWRADRDGRLQELATEIGDETTLHLERAADGYRAFQKTQPSETQLAYATGTIESSLFEDGLTAGLSEGVLVRLVEIFGWDIDFAQQLRRGDSFAVIYEEKVWRGQKIADGRVLAAEFVNQGKTYRAIAFRDARGRTDYYTPEGLSLRRPFLRTPVEYSRISSRFSRRFHPVLKTWRAHTGVDYAAPTGTPVRATAAGRIAALGWHGGYGRRVVVRHGGTYSTLYGHLSRFASKLRVGGLVEQGQVIGYVGATGLATGPHLHYELQVNGRHQNPLTFKFPGAAPLPSDEREAFRRAAAPLTARLDLIGRNSLVASSK